MKFRSKEQRKAVMAKLMRGTPNPIPAAPPGKASPKGHKLVPMKQPPEEWLSPARYQIKQARDAVKDKQYRIGWQNAYESIEKTIKAAAPFRTKTLGPAYKRTHQLPLPKLRTRYPEITDKMVNDARWMEQDLGYEAKYPNGKPVAEADVLRAISLAECLIDIIGKDPRRGLGL